MTPPPVAGVWWCSHNPRSAHSSMATDCVEEHGKRDRIIHQLCSDLSGRDSFGSAHLHDPGPALTHRLLWDPFPQRQRPES